MARLLLMTRHASDVISIRHVHVTVVTVVAVITASHPCRLPQRQVLFANTTKLTTTSSAYRQNSAIDEFQINEINVDLRTSGFDNEVLSVDACAV